MSKLLLLRRFAGFYATPLVAVLIPFLTLPFVARTATTSEWVAVSVGYALGGSASVLVALGWPFTGAHEVASASAPEARELYLTSVRLRTSMLTAAAAPQALLAVVVAPEGLWVETWLVSLSASALGLQTSWYSIGLGRPTWIGIYDVAPRVVGAALGVALLNGPGGLYAFACSNILWPLLGVAVFTRRVASEGRRSASSRASSVRQELRVRSTSTASEVAGSVFRVLPPSLFALTASTSDAAMYAASDRTLRLCMFSILALGNSLVAWVASPNWSSRRARRAVWTHVTTGVVGMVGLAASGPWFSSLFFGSRYGMGYEVSCALGLAYLLISVQTGIVRFVLLPHGLAKHLVPVYFCGALLSIIAFPLLAKGFGVAGGISSILIVELFVLTLTVAAARRPRIYGHSETPETSAQ